MSVRFHKLAILLIGLPVFAAVANPAAAQETATSALDQPQRRTWTDSSGKHKIEGEFVKLTDGMVAIRSHDGKLVHIPLEKFSDEDQKYIRQATKPAAKDTSHPLAENGAKSSKQTDTKIVVKGTGLSDEKALKAAFDEAVRQAIGVFVDAETQVRNNDLIEEKILTYSGGFVTSHEIVKKEVKDGIHEVTIAAIVKRGTLVERLKENNVTVMGFDGEELAEGDKRPEILVERALEGWPQGLLSATAQDWTILKQQEQTATIQVLVKIGVDLEKYGNASQRLSDVLDKVASKTTELKWRPNGQPYNVAAGYETVETSDRYTEQKGTHGWSFGTRSTGILPQSQGDLEHSVIVLRPTRASTAMLHGKLYQLDYNTWSRFVTLYVRPATIVIDLLDDGGQVVSSGKIGYDSTCSLCLRDIYGTDLVRLNTVCGLQRESDRWRFAYDLSLTGDGSSPDKVLSRWDKRSPVVIGPLLTCSISHVGGGIGLLSVVTFKVPIEVQTTELPAVKKVRCGVESTKGKTTDK